ncbi:MAG TPA: hydroxyacid dehydrogenase [Ruminococcaceae bacterium]|nr:hydroxyacid dehydrogenase [Oscillospiraceae bacterium]
MKVVVLDRDAMGWDISFSALLDLGHIISYGKTTPDELAEKIEYADAVIVNKVRIDRSAIEHAKKLRLICEFATGYDNIDIEAAKERGIAVCNVPGYSTESVTLFTVTTVLSLVTHIREYHDFVRNGAYTSSGVATSFAPAFHELSGMTWGIIGYGNIGSRVGDVARALGARVIVNRRTPTDDDSFVSIDELCRCSDIITVHCPLNDETRGIIDYGRISAMKDDVILVNEARGAVLDEHAVAEAVISGKIAGFGCDVYSEEPLRASHPYYAIRNYENVILTPHAAWGAVEARKRCISIIDENIRSYLRGVPHNRIV